MCEFGEYRNEKVSRRNMSIACSKRERESEEEQAERDRGKKDREYVNIEMQHDIDIYAKEEDSRIDACHIDAHLVSVV